MDSFFGQILSNNQVSSRGEHYLASETVCLSGPSVSEEKLVPSQEYSPYLPQGKCSGKVLLPLCSPPLPSCLVPLVLTLNPAPQSRASAGVAPIASDNLTTDGAVLVTELLSPGATKELAAW